MPGSVPNAAPATVMPWGLCKAFTPSREWAVLGNEYRNGESQRSKLVETSRKKWAITRRLTTAQLQTLWNFWNARKGTVEPFYYYDPTETSPKYSYDPTGVETIGRYTVRFDGAWSQEIQLGRAETSFGMIQLA